MTDTPPYTLVLSGAFKRIVKKLKRRDPAMLRQLEGGVAKILREPVLGKPLGNALRNYRRIHVEGSFVLLYELKGYEVRLIDLDHHDKIYKKYS
jgi:mRNA-degrading endonuclease RelE of RelBE toxin-antitoxin system